MGGIAIMDAVEEFAEKYGKEIKCYYEELLLGKTVLEFLGTKVDFYVFGHVRLSDDSVFETHFRWSDEEEDNEGKELDERYWLMEEYYKKFVLGKKIIRIEVGIEDDMFDECYVKAYVSEETHLAIPIGINQFRYEYRKFLNRIGNNEES